MSEVSATTVRPPKEARNGVNTPALLATIDAVKGAPDLAKFRFRATNRWVSGTYSESRVESFSGAGGEHTHQTATSKSELGRLLLRRGDLDGAERLLQENIATTQHVLGADHPNTAAAKGSLALVRLSQGRVADAEALLQEAIGVKRRVFGERHPEYAVTLNLLANDRELQGRFDEAQTMLEECLRITRPSLPEDHWRMLAYAINLSRVRIARGATRPRRKPALRQILQAREHLYPHGDWRIAEAQSLLAAALMAQGRDREAEPLMLSAARALKPIPGPQDRERAANSTRLALLYERSGRAKLAAAHP